MGDGSTARLKLQFLDEVVLEKGSFRLVDEERGVLSDDEYAAQGIKRGGLQPNFRRSGGIHRQAILTLVAALTVQSQRQNGLPKIHDLLQRPGMRGQGKRWAEARADLKMPKGTFLNPAGTDDFLIAIPTDLDEVVDAIARKQLSSGQVDRADRFFQLLDKFESELREGIEQAHRKGKPEFAVSQEICDFLGQWQESVGEVLEHARSLPEPPLAPLGQIIRPELEARLRNWRDSGSRSRVLIVHGPEGSGKSGLLRGFVDYCGDPAQNDGQSYEIHFHDLMHETEGTGHLREVLSSRDGEIRHHGDLDELLSDLDFLVIDHLVSSTRPDDLATLVRRQIEHPQENIRIIVGWVGALPEWAHSAQTIDLEKHSPVALSVLFSTRPAISPEIIQPATDWIDRYAPTDIAVASDLKSEIVSGRVDVVRIKTVQSEIAGKINDPQLADLADVLAAARGQSLTEEDLSEILALRPPQVGRLADLLRDSPGIRTATDRSMRASPLFRCFVNPLRIARGGRLIAEAFISYYSRPESTFHPTYLCQAGIRHVAVSMRDLRDRPRIAEAICNKSWLETAWRDWPRELANRLTDVVGELDGNSNAPGLQPLVLHDLPRLVREACQIGEIPTDQSFWGSLHNAALSLGMDATAIQALEQLAMDRGDSAFAYLKLRRGDGGPLKRLWSVDMPQSAIQSAVPLDAGRVAATLLNGGVAIVDGTKPRPPTIGPPDANIVASTGEVVIVGSPDGLNCYSADALAGLVATKLEVEGVRYSPVDVIPYGPDGTLTLARATEESDASDVIIEHAWRRDGLQPRAPIHLPGAGFQCLIEEAGRGIIIYGDRGLVRVSHTGEVEDLTENLVQVGLNPPRINDLAIDQSTGSIAIASPSGLFAVSSDVAFRIGPGDGGFNGLTNAGPNTFVARDDDRLILINASSPDDWREIGDVDQAFRLQLVGGRVCCLARGRRLNVVDEDEGIEQVRLPQDALDMATFGRAGLLTWSRNDLTAWDLTEFQPQGVLTPVESLAVSSDRKPLAVAIRDSHSEIHIDGLAMESEPIGDLKEVVSLESGRFSVRSDRALWLCSAENDRLSFRPVDIPQSKITASCADGHRTLLALSEGDNTRLVQVTDGIVNGSGLLVEGEVSQLAASSDRTAALLGDGRPRSSAEWPESSICVVGATGVEVNLDLPFFCTAMTWSGESLLLGDDAGSVRLYDRHPRGTLMPREGFKISTGDERIEKLVALDLNSTIVQTDSFVYLAIKDQIEGTISDRPEQFDAAVTDNLKASFLCIAKEGKLEWGKLIRRE